MAIEKLTDRQCRTAKAAGKEYSLGDGGGLYLIIKSNGTRSWSFRYTHPISSKAAKIGLGGYPATSLQLAREKAQAQRDLISRGLDPQKEREKEKEARVVDAGNTFGVLAEAWFGWKLKKKRWNEDSQGRIRGLLDKDILPWLSEKPISEMTRSDVALTINRVVDAQKKDTPLRVRSVISAIFEYAIEFHNFPEYRNFMRGKNVGGLVGYKAVSHPTMLDKKKIGKLINDIRGVSGTLMTRTALRILPYVWQRPGNIRQMEWEELDLNSALWSIPASKMKMGEEHDVPLPKQVVEALRDLQPLTGSSGRGPVFPNVSRKKEKASPYMSENTINKALQRLGYDTQKDITGHGFRSMARTILPQDLGIPSEWAERHLAHVTKEENGEAYDRAKYVEKRREMIQIWADWLDHLADESAPAPAPLDLGSNVVPLRRVA